MIIGIGIDIVQIARVERLYRRFGQRFITRVLAEHELQELSCVGANMAPSFTAKRFAAKEAAVKALGTGFSDGLFYRDIWVENNYKGKPSLGFSDTAKVRLEKSQVSCSHLSISDEVDMAVAFVVLER